MTTYSACIKKIIKKFKKKTKIVFAFRTVQTVVNNEPVASDYFLSHISNYQILIVTYGDSLYWNTDWWWFKEMTLALANLKFLDLCEFFSITRL